MDDSFHSHPKSMRASLAALGLWSVAGSWSGEHLTDGFVPDYVLPSLSRGASQLADELVEAGLWRRAKGGYRFHEWAADRDGTRRNFTAKEVSDRRAKRADAGRKGGKQKAANASDQGKQGQQVLSNELANARAPAKQPPSTDPKSPSTQDPKERSKDLSSRQAATDDPDFDRFWAVYPRRVAKRAAEKQWASALKRAGPETIIEGAKRYAEAQTGRDPSYTKHPATWLNYDCWDDEHPTGSVRLGPWCTDPKTGRTVEL